MFARNLRQRTLNRGGKFAVLFLLLMGAGLTVSQTGAYWMQPQSANSNASSTITVGQWSTPDIIPTIPKSVINLDANPSISYPVRPNTVVYSQGHYYLIKADVWDQSGLTNGWWAADYKGWVWKQGIISILNNVYTKNDGTKDLYVAIQYATDKEPSTDIYGGYRKLENAVYSSAKKDYALYDGCVLW